MTLLAVLTQVTESTLPQAPLTPNALDLVLNAGIVAKEKPQKGEVVAVGTGKVDKNGKKIPMSVKKGDKILFGKYAGDEWKSGGDEYLFLSDDEILAIL